MMIYNKPDIIPVNTVLNATRNSLAMQLQNMFGFAIQVFFTGTPAGNFKLQSSCDPVPQQSAVVQANGVIVYTPVHWTDIANSTFTVSAAGNVEWNVTDVGYNYVRVVYTDTSGGTSTSVISSAVFNGKGI